MSKLPYAVCRSEVILVLPRLPGERETPGITIGLHVQSAFDTHARLEEPWLTGTRRVSGAETI